MRTLTLILLLFFIQSVQGQDNIAELKSHLETIERTDSLKDNIKKAKFKELYVLTVFVDLERKIDFGYKHHRYHVMPALGEDLKLNFISKDGLIVHGWISEYDSNKKRHLELETFRDSPNFTEQYVSRHNEFYRSNLNFADFEEQLQKEYVVGFGCGSTGQEISKESKAILKYVKGENSTKLNAFLASFSPELQTLGAIGLLRIGNPNEEQTRIIQHLMQRNSVIFSCMGCLYGVGETFNERIKQEE